MSLLPCTSEKVELGGHTHTHTHTERQRETESKGCRVVERTPIIIIHLFDKAPFKALKVALQLIKNSSDNQRAAAAKET